MNKSIAVFNLKLPDDLLHYICEFIYYTYDDCIKHQREKKQKVNNIIHNDAEFAINEYMLSFNKAFSIETDAHLGIDTHISSLFINNPITFYFY
jgi:hypothetical protein